MIEAGSDQSELHRSACDAVLDHLQVVLGEVVVPGPLQAVAADMLAGVAGRFAETAPHDVVAVHVPLAVGDALGHADAEPSSDPPSDRSSDMVGVAAACTALYVGGRLLDDLIDGHDVSYFSQDRSAGDVLGWATFLGIVPPLVLSRLGVGAELRVTAIDAMATGMASMASGQLDDARPAGLLPTADEAMAAVEGKTGALVATFAEVAALVSGADSAARAAAQEYGMALGIARQLTQDLAALDPDPGRRVDRRSIGWPLAIHAEQLGDAERRRFEAMAEAGRGDAQAWRAVAAQVVAGEAPAQVAMTIELQVARALAAAERLSPERAERLWALAEPLSALGST